MKTWRIGLIISKYSYGVRQLCHCYIEQVIKPLLDTCTIIKIPLMIHKRHTLSFTTYPSNILLQYYRIFRNNYKTKARNGRPFLNGNISRTLATLSYFWKKKHSKIPTITFSLFFLNLFITNKLPLFTKQNSRNHRCDIRFKKKHFLFLIIRQP